MFWGKLHAFLPTAVQSSIPQLERMTSLLLIQGRHMLIDIPYVLPDRRKGLPSYQEKC